jgi:hypothetical protein
MINEFLYVSLTCKSYSFNNKQEGLLGIRVDEYDGFKWHFRMQFSVVRADIAIFE